jgi:hypothetical protein
MLSKSFVRGTVAALALAIPLLGAGIFHPAGAAGSETKKKCPQTKTSCSKAVKASCCMNTASKGCGSACRGDCAGGGACCKAAAAKQKAKHIAAIKTVMTDLPYNESRRLVLTGQVVCGKCQLQKFESCQAMFKTKDGKLYPLVSNGKVRQLKMNSKGEFQITTRVKRLDGIKYLEVTNFTEL